MGEPFYYSCKALQPTEINIYFNESKIGQYPDEIHSKIDEIVTMLSELNEIKQQDLEKYYLSQLIFILLFGKAFIFFNDKAPKFLENEQIRAKTDDDTYYLSGTSPEGYNLKETSPEGYNLRLSNVKINSNAILSALSILDNVKQFLKIMLEKQESYKIAYIIQVRDLISFLNIHISLIRAGPNYGGARVNYSDNYRPSARGGFRKKVHKSSKRRSKRNRRNKRNKRKTTKKRNKKR